MDDEEGLAQSASYRYRLLTKMKDAGADGIDDTDTTVISKKKAYELASKELLKAKQIGDTEGNAKVGGSSENYVRIIMAENLRFPEEG